MTIRNINHLKNTLFASIIIIILYVVANIVNLPIQCGVVRIFGIECMSCGMTRAWLALLSGNIEQAFYFHPLFIFPAIAVILFSLNHYFLKEEKKSIKYILLFMLIIYLIFYLVRMNYNIPGVYELDNHFDLFNH